MFNNLKYPIIQAPMAGGVSTVELATAVSRKGGLGFLAAGYKSPEAIEQEISVCATTALPYGVNLFMPQCDAIDKSLHLYKTQLAHDFQLQLTIREATDDFWQGKIKLVMKYKVPYVSFTFGCPSKEIIQQLKNNGSKIIVTVTNLSEASIAIKNGADAICLQGIDAGGHRATFQNSDETSYLSLVNLIHTVRKETAIPIIAAGGIMDGRDIHLALCAGANAVQLGTAFLCTPESGANTVYKQALLSNHFSETVLTRAFTGRLARGLKNDYTCKYDKSAPAIYPAVHTLTQPIRTKALNDRNPHAMALWANTRFKELKHGTVDEIIEHLIQEWHLVKG
jgi:nitronate monooxygenase